MAYLLAILQPELLQHHAIMFVWVWNETNKTLLAMVGSDWIMTAEFGWWLWEHLLRKIRLKSQTNNGLFIGHIATRTASTSCNHVYMGME